MRRLAALIAMSALGACVNEVDESTRPDVIAGTYQLVSYAGKPLPYSFPTDGSVQSELLAGELVMASDQQWTETESIRFTAPGSTQIAPIVSAGSWMVIRPQAYLSFRDTTNNYQFSGTGNGGTIVLTTTGGSQLVYRR